MQIIGSGIFKIGLPIAETQVGTALPCLLTIVNYNLGQAVYKSLAAICGERHIFFYLWNLKNYSSWQTNRTVQEGKSM
jgi:hypothetical protein